MKTKFIDGFGDRYTISEDGTVTSMYRLSNIHGVLLKVGNPKVIKRTPDKKGYLVVNLYKGDGKPHQRKVHRLVAQAFLENPDNKRCVCHKDNNPANCHVSNLYWGTDKENQEQAWNDGLHKNMVPVVQIDMDGNVVGIYESQSDAGRKTKIAQQNICKCTNGDRESAGGYLWQRLD